MAAAAITFRHAAAADADALVEVINLAYRVEDFFVEGDRTDAAGVLEHLSRGVFIVAAGAVGPIAGCIHVTAEGRHGHFGMLAIHPAAQRAGLGRALVSEAERYCRERGCDDVTIEVVNLRAELPDWYASLGYVATGIAPFAAPEKQKLPCHFILMSRQFTANPLEATR